MGVNYNPGIVTNGLVLCLDAANKKSYPKSGITITDNIAQNTGVLIGGITYNSSNNGIFLLDGTTGYIQGSFSQVLFGNSNSHTVNLWINKLGTNSSNWAYIYDKYGNTRCPGLLFYLNTNQLVVEYWQTGVSWVNMPTGLTINQNQWYFISMRVSAGGTGATKSFTVDVYSNTATVSATVSSTADWDASVNGNLNLGRSISNNTYSNCQFGMVTTYNRILSASEVSQNFNALRGRYGI